MARWGIKDGKCHHCVPLLCGMFKHAVVGGGVVGVAVAARLARQVRPSSFLSLSRLLPGVECT